MALKKYLKLIMENCSGRTLKLYNHKLEDGGFNNNSSFPEKMENNMSFEVELKTKVAGNGPKGYADYVDEKDENVKFRICFELSRNSANARYVYLLPVGDYVFDGSYKMYGEGIWPKKEDSNDFSAVVRIGEPVKAEVFYHITDTHFNDSSNNQEECVTRLMEEIINIETKDELHPDDNNCIIKKLNHVLGIIHTGDICYQDENDNTYQNYFFRAEKSSDFEERTSPGSNRRWINPFHLLEGYGNHDIDGGEGSFDRLYYDKVRNMIIDRNHYDEFSAKSRMPGVIVDSDDHMHYRWKWHGVNFIQLNLAPMDEKTKNGYDCHKAFKFLNETASTIGKEPLLIYFHIYSDYAYNNEESGPRPYFRESDYENLAGIIQRTNTIAICNGHWHASVESTSNIPYFKRSSMQEVLNCKSKPVPILKAGSFQAGKEERYHSFVRCEFKEENQIEFAFYNSNEVASCIYTLSYTL
jgi:hypothetical protein